MVLQQHIIYEKPQRQKDSRLEKGWIGVAMLAVTQQLLDLII